MTTYTITKTEILRLAKARELQCAKARDNHFKTTGDNLSPTSPEANTAFTNVQFVNGTSAEFALPIGRLAAWTRLIENDGDLIHTGRGYQKRNASPDKTEFSVAFQDGKLRVDHGPSSISLCTFAETAPIESGKGWRRSNSTPREFFGQPIRMVAPEHGGAFTVDFDESKAGELSALKSANTKAKADSVKRAKFQKAKREERSAMDAMQSASKEHCANLETCGAIIAPIGIVFDLGRYDAALGMARLCLKARRMLRRALATPELCPEWLPESYSESRTREELRRDGSGNLIVREYWQEDVAKCVAKVGNAAFDPDSTEFNSFYFESDSVEYSVAHDSRAEHAGLVAELVKARAAAAEYKPRVSRFAAYHRIMRQRHKRPLLKHEKLAAEVAAAESHLAGFIRSMFRSECELNGLPAQTGQGIAETRWAGFSPIQCKEIRSYSRARIAVREWAGRKAELAARYIAAIQNTKHQLTIRS